MESEKCNIKFREDMSEEEMKELAQHLNEIDFKKAKECEEKFEDLKEKLGNVINKAINEGRDVPKGTFDVAILIAKNYLDSVLLKIAFDMTLRDHMIFDENFRKVCDEDPQRFKDALLDHIKNNMESLKTFEKMESVSAIAIVEDFRSFEESFKKGDVTGDSFKSAIMQTEA